MFVTSFLSTWMLLSNPHPTCINVLGTNDMHGVIEPLTRTVQNPTLRHTDMFGPATGVEIRSDTTLRYGGVFGLSAYVQAIRTHSKHPVVLLDGGDIYQGTLTSNTSQGEALITAMNILGYTASAVGNHEFDYGPTRTQPSDMLGVVKKRIAQARFPFLASNIQDTHTGLQPAWKNLFASTLVHMNGLNIGIIGASTPQTPYTTLPHQVASLAFLPPANRIVEEAKRLREQGAQWVILTAHMGGQCPLNGAPHNDAQCNTEDDELVGLLRSLPKGTLDIAVGGHTHALMAHWVNGVAVIESGARTQYLGWIESCLNSEGKPDPAQTVIHPPTELCLDTWKDTGTCEPRTQPSTTQQASFLGHPVKVSPMLKRAMRPYIRRARAVENAPLGVLVHHTLGLENPGSTNLGNKVAKAMLEALHTDVAVQNRGGVRTDIQPGPLRYGAVYQALPFDNALVKATLSGKDILSFIETLTHARTRPLPYIAGIACNTTQPLQCVFENTQSPLDPSATYTLSTNDFLARGGDGAAVFAQIPNNRITFTSTTVRDAFIAFAKRWPQEF